jgi:hypothetical protein
MEIGKYIDDMIAIRGEKKYHEAEIKRLDAQLGQMEAELMQEMIKQGTTEAKGVYGKATFNEKVLYPQVEDWSILHNFIQETGYFDLLHKRMSLTNYRQLAEANQDPPGVLRNYVSEISLRSL